MANDVRLVKELKRFYLSPSDVSEKAFEVYSDSDALLFTDSEGNIYEAFNSLSSYACLIGTLEDVEKYLIEIRAMDEQ